MSNDPNLSVGIDGQTLALPAPTVLPADKLAQCTIAAVEIALVAGGRLESGGGTTTGVVSPEPRLA